MSQFLALEKYSIGVGDRFGQQAQAQLRACMLAEKNGLRAIPVWNKSHREHVIIGSDPADTRRSAKEAVDALDWKHPHHVDADHVRLDTVDRFLPHADYFTLDVGDAIGGPISEDAIGKFMDKHPEFLEEVSVPKVMEPLHSSQTGLLSVLRTYLPAAAEAGTIYRHITNAKRDGRFITEVSMDETVQPQTPFELLVILAALADEGVRVQTIAPKFTGRFNKGIDYVGDVGRFSFEFKADLAVIAFAIHQYDLPSNLKLSVHSGSDKFALYLPIHEALKEFDAGLHLKTAGTTWLEELIGLAQADQDGCEMVKSIYSAALGRIDELCEPYAAVIAIDRAKLPSWSDVERWTSSQLVSAIAHDALNPAYNSHMRQLLHVGYRIAAEIGPSYIDSLRRHKALIAERVTANLYENHLKLCFPSEHELPAAKI